MTSLLLYTACVLGAVAMYLMLRPGAASLRMVGAAIGLATLGWLLSRLGMAAGDAAGVERPTIVFLILSAVAICAAGRMVTHHRPVYSALYFILVVLSSAGLFLVMEAEFMAFALVIVYAGAIIVTYLFVLMLAQQTPAADTVAAETDYDRVPREPQYAVVVGFLMLALLGSVIFQQGGDLPAQRSTAEARHEAWAELATMPGQARALIIEAELRQRGDGLEDHEDHEDHEELVREDADEDIELGWSDNDAAILPAPDGRSAQAFYRRGGEQRQVRLEESAVPDNITRVGLALVADFPVSLELAGIILLMAMFGAVVLARRQIELGEDELRQAAGLGPYALDASEISDEPRAGGEGARS